VVDLWIAALHDPVSLEFFSRSFSRPFSIFTAISAAHSNTQNLLIACRAPNFLERFESADLAFF
jgi:hypothetical protein